MSRNNPWVDTNRRKCLPECPIIKLSPDFQSAQVYDDDDVLSRYTLAVVGRPTVRSTVYLLAVLGRVLLVRVGWILRHWLVVARRVDCLPVAFLTALGMSVLGRRPLAAEYIAFITVIHGISQSRLGWSTAVCTVVYFNVLYCTIMYCTVLLYTVLYCTNTVLYCTIIYCTVLYYYLLYCTVLIYTVLYCTVPLFTALYYIVLLVW